MESWSYKIYIYVCRGYIMIDHIHITCLASKKALQRPARIIFKSLGFAWHSSSTATWPAFGEGLSCALAKSSHCCSERGSAPCRNASKAACARLSVTT